MHHRKPFAAAVVSATLAPLFAACSSGTPGPAPTPTASPPYYLLQSDGKVTANRPSSGFTILDTKQAGATTWTRVAWISTASGNSCFGGVSAQHPYGTITCVSLPKAALIKPIPWLGNADVSAVAVFGFTEDPSIVKVSVQVNGKQYTGSVVRMAGDPSNGAYVIDVPTHGQGLGEYDITSVAGQDARGRVIQTVG